VKEWSRTQVLLPANRFAEGAFLAKVLAFFPDFKDDQEDFSAEDFLGP
jgi:hypothetical protein